MVLHLSHAYLLLTESGVAPHKVKMAKTFVPGNGCIIDIHLARTSLLNLKLLIGRNYNY